MAWSRKTNSLPTPSVVGIEKGVVIGASKHVVVTVMAGEFASTPEEGMNKPDKVKK